MMSGMTVMSEWWIKEMPCELAERQKQLSETHFVENEST
tara:strand:+ start:261 stop:377 length:117 start_codon:yes stop_codon:yes gene_type:complete